MKQTGFTILPRAAPARRAAHAHPSGPHRMRCAAFFVFALILAGCSRTQPESIVLFITQDGLRWQEVFSGADETLLDEKDKTAREAFLRPTAEERRRALMPFLWETIASQGQIYGNPAKGSVARVTNGKKFSYPGYNEMLAGAPDPRIDSNDKVPNPNVNVLEWLSRQPGFDHRITAFGTWELLPFILNRERSGLDIVAAGDFIREEPLTERERAFNDLKRDTPEPWEGNPFDAFFFHAAMEHIKRHPTRVLYLMLGETDEWAHEGKYGQYLRAIRRTDGFVRRAWETARQIAPGRVSLVFTTDHGRGNGPEWRSHGEKIEGAEKIWIALLGDGIQPLGERASIPDVTQSQIAATVADLAGQDYAAAFPNAAKSMLR